MGQHGSPFIRDIQNIAVTFLALRVFKGCIGAITALFPIIGPIGKVDEYIFDAVDRLCIKKVHCILGGRQVAVHTIRDKSLGVVYMGRGFPRVKGGLNLMTGGAESRR